jgi:transcriptional regulator with XRE-family HTH domain
MSKAREYGGDLKRLGSAKLAKLGGRSANAGDSDGSDLFQDPTFREHFEDAEVRSCLLRGLVKARNSAGRTQAMVAQSMETTQSAVSELEGGETDPRLSTLQRYARAVGAHLQVRLNLFASIAQEPSQWPDLAPNMVVNIGTSTVSANQSSSYYGLILTDDIPEPVAG